MDKTSLTLGRYMRTKRETVKLSLAEVARQMDWNSTQFVWNLEHEVSVVPIKYIKKLCRIYKVKDLEMRKEIARYLTRKIYKKYGLTTQ